MAAVAPSAGWRVWWLAIRPRTLAVGAAPVVAGTALAWADGGVHAWVAGAALAVALLLQVASNLANDVFDHERGADGPDRVGPPRASQLGLLSPSQLRRAVVVVLAAAVLAGLALVARGGWPLAAVGAVAVVAAVAYTGGPWPLGYRGLGDVAVFLFFGVVAVCGSYYVQALTLPPEAVLASLGPGSLATAVLVANNLRDLESDARVGKRTLAVRLGRRGSVLQYGALVSLAFAVPAVFAALRGPWMLLPWALAPWAAVLVGDVARQPEGPALNAVLGRTARLTLGWALSFGVGALAAAS